MADMVTTAMTIFQLLQQVAAAMPATQTPTATEAARPKTVLMQSQSIAEVGQSILKCYHPSGRFRSVDVMEVPWQRGAQYNTKKSAMLRVNWNGAVLQTNYALYVAMVERDGKVLTVIQSDNATIPPNKNCSLAQWTEVQK